MLWEGLPISQCSWESASSLDFDVNEIAESLPDLTGCHQADIDNILSATASASASFQFTSDLKYPHKRPAQGPGSSLKHLKRPSFTSRTILSTDSHNPFAVTSEENWWDFLPTLNK